MNETTAEKSIATVMLPARVDSETSRSAEETMMASLHPGARVVIDGSAVTYMSAAGVRSLATVLHRAQEMQARIVFCRFTGAAADCLQVSGFGHLLDVAESAEAAAARL
ncbi:MAG: STAS domain-containing protein [Enhydrobacter sp.]|nr:MAG: STAS domain-containing protein [Enhydrobacter sp.]